MKKQKSKKGQDPYLFMRELGWSEDFAFIAGFTGGGAPFGTTWEELEELEKQEAELAEIRRNRPIRTIHVDMNDLETAFELRDDVFAYWLDTESGKCLMVPGYAYDGDATEEMEADMEIIDSAPSGRFLQMDSDGDLRPSVEDAFQFVREVEDQRLRKRLNGALGQRRGAFRRFLDILHDEAGEVERWHYFSRQKLRENIVAHLRADRLEITYDALPPFQPSNDTREHLLAGAAKFVDRVKGIKGVERIALLGSMTSSKNQPNDVDLLVTVSTHSIIPDIAAAGRKLKGHTQQLNRGADIFIAGPTGAYIGRTCEWRECRPGIRTRCQAQHCGNHLYDDLQVLTLPQEVIDFPPLEIWPRVVVRGELPEDVLEAFGIER